MFSHLPLCPFLPLTGDESKKKKKSVSWAEEGSLVNIHYFEMDESERGGSVCRGIHMYTVCQYIYMCVSLDTG